MKRGDLVVVSAPGDHGKPRPALVVQIMIDKLVSLRRERIGAPIGTVNADTLVRVNRSLALFLGLGD